MSNPNHLTVDYRSQAYPLQSMHPQGSQQYPQGYYPDQYQQYQQLLNGSNQQPYNSYYMYGQPQGQQGVAALGQSGASQLAQAQDPTYGYSRYHNNYVPPGYASGYLGAGQAGASGAGGSGASSMSGAAQTLQTQGQPTQAATGLSQPQPQQFVQMSGLGSSYAGQPTLATPLALDTVSATANLSVGQYQPPGIRPRVTTTMWEDEKTLCYQVDANNVLVVRRADNNMINGTKLLNVAQMTRGRRDGILKLEKVRHVVKIGSMHLKGVWIPFDRALAMAQREGIVDLLYPLFVRDIKRVILTGVTPASGAGSGSGVAAPVASAGAPSASAAAVKSSASHTPATQSAATGSAPAQSYSNYYQGYSQYQQANGAGSQASPQQGQAQEALQAPPQQLQMYSYQQPYYANQYYPPYNPTSGYSSYGSQPMYSTAYGYQQQMQQQPMQGHAAAQHLAAPSDAASGGHTSASGASNDADRSLTAATSVEKKEDKE